MTKKVYVVIVNWNRIEDTLACLKSVYDYKLNDFSLTTIVVDNGSTDNSLTLLNKESKKNKSLEVLETGKNLGFTGGNNFGIKYALKNGADYIVLLNNDTLVDKNMFQSMFNCFSLENVGIVSPKIYFAEGYEFHKDRYSKSELGKVIWYAGGKIDWNNVYGSNFGVDEVDRGQFDKNENIDFATGACMMVSKEVFERVGFFDDRYFAYLEDVDFSQRVKNAGFTIKFCPDAVLWHKVSKSSNIGSELNDYFITRNRLIFGMKYASLRAKIALIRESFVFLVSGRKWQRKGVLDYYFGKFGKGSWI